MKVKGTIVGCAEVLRSPVTGQPCVAYQVVAHGRDSEGGEIVVGQDSACADFDLLVDGRRYHVRARGSSKLGLRMQAIPGTGDLHGTIQLGDPVIVWGGVVTEVSPELPSEGYRQPPLRHIIAGDERTPVFISNRSWMGLLGEPISDRRGFLRTLLGRPRGDGGA